MNRKQRRALEKETNKKSAENIADKISQFQNLPDECLTCLSPFDKKNKEMANTWNVVVRDPETIRLYCPTCWDMARKVAFEYLKEKKEDGS